jgi:hypothetical protein
VVGRVKKVELVGVVSMEPLWEGGENDVVVVLDGGRVCSAFDELLKFEGRKVRIVIEDVELERMDRDGE